MCSGLVLRSVGLPRLPLRQPIRPVRSSRSNTVSAEGFLARFPRSGYGERHFAVELRRSAASCSGVIPRRLLSKWSNSRCDMASPCIFRTSSTQVYGFFGGKSSKMGRRTTTDHTTSAGQRQLPATVRSWCDQPASPRNAGGTQAEPAFVAPEGD